MTTPTRYYLDRLGINPRWRSLIFFEKRIGSPPVAAPPAELSIDSVTLAGLRPRHVIGWLDSAQAAQLLSRPDVRFFAAEIDGEVVGSGWLETAVVQLDFLEHEETLPADTAYLTHLIVVPGQRGHGIARALVDYAAKLAAELGKHRLTVACVPENTAVRRVFEKCGFQPYRLAVYRRMLGLRWYRSEKPDGGEKASWLSLGQCSLKVF